MEIQEKIIDCLGNGKKKTTYQIAEEVGITWGTATKHLYILKSQNNVDMKRVHEKNQEKIYWWKK